MAINYDLASEGGMKVYGDGGEDTVGVVHFKSAATTIPGLTISKSVNGSPTIAALRVAGTSAASAAVIGFGGGFISVTSILGIAATGAGIGFDYVLPVEINGVQRGIPLTSLISLPGAATF
jgi:hypothetical protein